MGAHKLNSVIDADEIIMIDDGRILARGTHESLLRDSEAYRNLWDMYVSADKWRFNAGEREQ